MRCGARKAVQPAKFKFEMGETKMANKETKVAAKPAKKVLKGSSKVAGAKLMFSYKP